MDKYIGRLLDNRYEILEVLGTGGMAVVYKARCHRLNRLVAIKILKDDYLEDEEFRRRFHSESQAVAMLSHPNIVSVYDVSTSITADYIVMELIDGITLKQYMEKKGTLNWKETLHFAIQIAKALDHAHSKGIVHRDIKPHNIMVLKNGSVKVTDFGIARMMSKGNTLTKEALGSVHYISPEQAKGGRVDNRSDIYSLGVVMYEMMSGRPPYDGDSPVAVAIQHINGGAVLPSTLNPNIPGGLEQIIMKAMSHEASDRYVSATQMLTDMDEFRKDPAILFDYNTPPLDEVTKLQKPPLVLEVPEVKTTAEQVERRASSEHRSTNSESTPQRRKPASQSSNRQPARRNTQAAEKRSNAATIAIISCCLVMVVAIVIFLVVLFNGGATQKPQLVEVPNLIGQVYDTLPEYPDFEVKIDKNVHDDDVPAGQIMDQTPKGGEQIVKNEKIYVTVSLGPAEETPQMPDLVNWEQSKAEQYLNSLDLKLQLVSEYEYHDTVVENSVIRTEPSVGTELKQNQTIKLFVSKGVEIKTTTMPDITASKKENAKKILEDQKLDLKITFEEVFDSNVAEGDVIRTEPAAKEELKTGQSVTVYISKGPEMGVMPNVTGIDIDKAVNILISAGFNTYQIEPVESEEDKDTVVNQSVEKNTEVDIKTEIILQVSKGPAETPDITKDVVIDLRGMAAEHDIHVKVKRGDEVVFDQTVTAGTATITLSGQTASGPVKYVVIIDDQEGFDHWEEFVQQ